jgi:DNA-binding MarR family transcriptional regulator
MQASTITALNRSDQIDGELSRTEVGLLNTLSTGPRRITELAELEGLAQPTMTSLVKQLEQQAGCVASGRPTTRVWFLSS